MTTDCQLYVDTVLTLYRELPDTPQRHSRYDRHLAAQLHQRQVPLPLIEAAFLLATVRRQLRDPSYPSLFSIRSLHYFLPLIDELLHQPLAPNYLAYLRHKLASQQPPIILSPINPP